MPNLTPGFIADQEAEAARQRAAGRQKALKSKLGDSVMRTVNGNSAKYKAETKENWRRAAQESRMTGAARAYKEAQKGKK